jgi:enamine deaminase RidA (YjgF/YER057c/UK114 family)
MKTDANFRVKKRAIQSPQALCEAYDYPKKVSFSRGMRVELDNCIMLYISGTASVDEHGQSIHAGHFAAQARRTFANIAALLDSEGADWHDVVRTTCYLVNFAHYDEFNRIRNEFYDAEGLDPYPASTCIEARLCRPELMVEIEAIAMLPKDRPVRPLHPREWQVEEAEDEPLED